MTGGILRNQAREGKLDRYAQIILDEAFVFDLNTEYLLSQCMHHFRTATYKFRITLMSATISKDAFLEFFKEHGGPNNGRSIHKVIGQTNYPREDRFLKFGGAAEFPTDAVSNPILKIHQEYPITPEGPNGFLVSLPGKVDFDAVKDYFCSTEVTSVLVRLPPLELKEAVGGKGRVDLRHFNPPQIGRQVILATTAAEISITIPDVGFVIGTGCTNTPIYDPVQRTHELITVHVSRSQAAQRVGRAGRAGSGVTFGSFRPMKVTNS